MFGFGNSRIWNMKHLVNFLSRGKKSLVSLPFPVKGNTKVYLNKAFIATTRSSFSKEKGAKFRFFHKSSQRLVNPLFAVFFKYGGIKVLKGATIIGGRMSRKLHDKLPEGMRRQLARHTIIYSATMLSLPIVCYYSYTHYETCPMTGRKRFITFTKDQVIALSELDYKSVMSQYQNKIVDKNSSVFKINREIVDKLVEGNSDLDIVKDTKWTLNVIDDPDVTNAFVLPNGQIFVFSGMLKMLNSWEEMAIILGHEMSHAILGHAQEQQSYLAFGELLTVPLLAFIWFFFDDFVAFLIYSIQAYLYPIIFEYGFKLPYSRQLEIEADEIGLLLATKACFDPRWSVLLWEKMSMREITSGDDVEEFDYISTHPSNQKRSLNLEQMIPDMLKKREAYNCPCFSQSCNPIATAHHIRKCVDNIRERKLVSQQIDGINSTLRRLPDSTDPDRNKKLPELQKDLNSLKKELERLESEYEILISSSEEKTEIKESNKEAKGGSIPELWYKVINGMITSGKVTNSIFEKKSEKVELHTVDIHKSPFSN